MTKRLLASLAMGLALVSLGGCKVRDELGRTSSLTPDELKSCSFKGKRFLMVVAPDFEQDAVVAQELFVQSSPTILLDSAYGAKNFASDPEALARCNADLQYTGKYEVHMVLSGGTADYAAFEQSLRGLGDKIARYRRTDPTGEVQVMLTFTSHGDDYGGNFPSGQVILGREGVAFEKVAALLYETLFHTANKRAADEVIVLMDNCYSGNFKDQMKAFLRKQPGYGTLIRSATQKELTRVIAFSSSNLHQVSKGGLNGTGEGTLVHIIKEMLSSWAADNNKEDGKLTFQEMFDYIESTSFGRFSGPVVERLSQDTAALVCGTVSLRTKTYEDLRRDSVYTERLFADPIGTVTTFDSPTNVTIGGGGPYDSPRASRGPGLPGVQRPVFFTNLAPEVLGEFAIAATDPVDHKTESGRILYETLVQKGKKNSAYLINLVNLQEKAFDLIKKDLDKYLKPIGKGGNPAGAQGGEATQGGGGPSGEPQDSPSPGVSRKITSGSSMGPTGSTGSMSSSSRMAPSVQDDPAPAMTREDLDVPPDGPLAETYQDVVGACRGRQPGPSRDDGGR